MVNKRVYNYLIKHSQQHSLKELKKKLIDSGYDAKVVNEAANSLGQQTPQRPVQKNNFPKANTQKTNANVVAVKNTPVKKTGNKLTPVAKTKTQVAPQKQMKQSKQVKPAKDNGVAKPKRSKKWLWILLVILFLLGGAGAVYYFFFR